MRKHIADVVVALILASCGIFFANFYYAMAHLFPFGVAPWWQWMPVVALPSVAALAAITVFFRRRVAGIAGCVSLLALALFSLREATSQITLELWNKALTFPEFFFTTGPMLLTAALAFWRFVMVPRSRKSTI